MKLKTLSSTIVAVAALSIIHFQFPTAFAQGSLTPPAGAPAPVMKSLDQIEPRTPLVAGQPGVSVALGGEITITSNGSYYLTKDLVTTNGGTKSIDVGVHDVTIDLNGFGIRNTSTNSFGTGYGIYIYGATGQRVTIRNGFITGSGTDGFSSIVGIYISGTSTGTALVEDVRCYDVYSGIYLNDNVGRNAVRNCSVENAGDMGIVADVVSGCTVLKTGNTGIRANSISDCYVYQNAGNASAIVAGVNGNGGLIQNSHGRSQGGIGISATSVMNSYGESVSGTGISTTTALNCTARRLNGTAINAIVANGCYAITGTNIIANKYNMP